MGNRRYDDSWGYHWRKGRQLTWMFGDYEEWVFSYNADGMRTGRLDEVSEKEYTYYYNGSLLRVMTVDGNKLYFVYDAAGTPIQLAYTPAGSTTTSYYYFVTNLQGDVIAILNSSGYSVVEYTYDAWGKVLSITGSMASTLGVQNPLRYRGYVYDQETSLYYLQSRYYDPEIGRFINADALVSTGQGLLGNNMFAYCNNNPVNYVDPSGHLAHFHFVQDLLDRTGAGGKRYSEPMKEVGCEEKLWDLVCSFVYSFEISGGIGMGARIEGNVADALGLDLGLSYDLVHFSLDKNGFRTRQKSWTGIEATTLWYAAGYTESSYRDFSTSEWVVEPASEAITLLSGAGYIFGGGSFSIAFDLNSFLADIDRILF